MGVGGWGGLGLSEEMMSAAVTAADVVRGAGGDISLLQLKAFEYLGNVIWSCGGAQMNRGGSGGGRAKPH